MMKAFLTGFAGLMLLLPACTGRVPLPPQYNYAKQAIVLYIKTDGCIDSGEDGHGVVGLCIYQLAELDEFLALSETPEGLEDLADCRTDSQGGEVYAKHFRIRAGQDYTILMDRAAEARFVGIVAGYAVLRKDAMVQYFPIPLASGKKGWFFCNTYEPCDMAIHLRLGAQGIEDARAGPLAD